MNSSSKWKNVFSFTNRKYFATMLQRTLSLLFVICLPHFGLSQYWFQSAGGSGTDHVSAISLDSLGNTYAVGYYTGSSQFGAISLPNSSNSDLFVAKIDQSGNYIWANSFGGNGTDRANSVATDNQGNSYITGFFNDSIQFGSTTLFSEGAQDVFIVKISNNGSVIWAKQFGGNLADIGTTISILANGNIAVAGNFSGTCTFGFFSLTSLNNSIDVFVSVLDPTDGSLVWLKKGGSKYDDTAVAIDCDNLGNINLTGSFSDSLQFDVLHPGTVLNAIYLIQFSSTGTENWFRSIAGSIYNIVNDLSCSPQGDIHLAGDFSGNLSFFGSVPFSLTGTEFSKSFVAKYNSIGGLVWAKKLFSENQINAKSISVDQNNKVWIGGSFECEFTQMQSFYADGIFIAVNESDGFVSHLSSNGILLESRQIASHGVFTINDLAVNQEGDLQVAANYTADAIVPTSTSFYTNNLQLWQSIGCTANANYCSDPDYSSYHVANSAAGQDLFIGNCIDLNRQPYDFYYRSGSACDRSKPSFELEGGNGSVQVCSVTNPTLSFDSIYCTDLSPAILHSFSTAPLANGNTKYVYSIEPLSSACLPALIDSIELISYTTSISSPLISDNQGINLNAATTADIELCGPANVVLSTSVQAPNTLEWLKNNQPFATTTSINADSTGVYTAVITDTNGCEASNSITVIIYDTLPTLELRLSLGDSVTFCENNIQPIPFLVYDSLSNPQQNQQCLLQFYPGTSIQSFTIEGTTSTVPLIQQQSINCGSVGSLSILDSGMVVLTVEVSYYNLCDTINVTLTDSVFVTINPAPPQINFNFNINGPEHICPFDTIQLIGTGDTIFNWFGPGVQGLSTDTVNISTEGFYTISYYISDTNQYGCTSTSYGYDNHNISVYQSPEIYASSLFLCPGDSATLTVSNTMQNAQFSWQGPSGNIGGNNTSINVATNGNYYCIASNSECALESNTLQIQQYSTPSITALTGNVLCAGDSSILNINSAFVTSINWLSPLSGNNPTQVVYSAGSYQCEIEACGITTLATAVIEDNTNTIEISTSGVLCKDSFTMLMVDSTMIQYVWSTGQLNTNNIQIADSGVYIIEVIDENGCLLTDTIQVNINQTFVDISLKTDTILCAEDTLKISSSSGLQSLVWHPALESTPAINVTSTGTYWLQASDSNGCVSNSDSFLVTFSTKELKLNIEENISLCNGDSLVLSILNQDITGINWFGLSDTNQNITITTDGIFNATGFDSNACFRTSDTFAISFKEAPFEPIFPAEIICARAPIELTASDQSIIYLANTSSSEIIDSGNLVRAIPNSISSQFIAWSELNGCFSDSIFSDLNIEYCDIEVPNVFTPNTDGINDWLEIRNCPQECFQFEIFNRWGSLIFISTSANIKWDGHVSSSGERAENGVYFYRLQYCTASKMEVLGSITLVR